MLIFIVAIVCIFLHAIFNSSKIIFADSSPKLSALMSSMAYILNVLTLPLVKYNVIIAIVCVGISSYIGSLIGIELSKLYNKKILNYKKTKDF